MSDQRSSDVLGALPHSRPHRRSQKRASRPAQTPAEASTATSGAAKRSSAAQAKPTSSRSKSSAAKRTTQASAKRTTQATPRATRSTAGKGPRIQQPAQPSGSPRGARASRPEPATRHDIFGTALQAAAELAEIGLTVSARALRGAVSRLPRP
jgi:hypothetical protein